VVTPAPASFWIPSPTYATPQALAESEEGEDYSYLQFVGREGEGMASTIDLPRLGTRFEVPVFLVHGAEDLLTTPELARRYLDAPAKAFVLVPRTGHDPNAALLAAEHEVLTRRVRPLVR
jgi:pimeloyl-ACP methyl ester carboxylesterase